MTIIISIANTAITKRANQLFVNSVGAKKPKMYSTNPVNPKIVVSEYLKASFRLMVLTTYKTIPLKRMTPQFKYMLVD